MRDAKRPAELAKIHIAKKELNLSDDVYRLMLVEIGGHESAGDLNQAGRRAVLDHLRQLGWKSQVKGRKPPHNLHSGRLSRQAQLQKIEALLTVGKLPWGYADALALRICKVDKIEFVPSEELYKIITALRKQAIRYGWDLSGEKG